MRADRDLQVQIAWACRILAMAGHEDLILGHVSACRPGSDIIYMKRFGLGLGEITPDDVLMIDRDARKLGGRGDVHLEAAMHTEVYRVRPDVGAVIHTHAPYTTAFGATSARFEFLSHDAVLFPDGLASFDETAELITSGEQGQAVARALGNRRAVLLRNHGVLVVGKSVPWAVLTALTLERAVQIQAIAISLGALQPMPIELVKRLHPYKYRDDFTDSYWHYLIRQVRRAGWDTGMPSEET
ncbi:MAG TPA: ribulose phosphate epimerase [Chloroflexi bacterium]|nr:ribulose phosphate epimerase [Chloroflexota bacterium]